MKVFKQILQQCFIDEFSHLAHSQHIANKAIKKIIPTLQANNDLSSTTDQLIKLIAEQFQHFQHNKYWSPFSFFARPTLEKFIQHLNIHPDTHHEARIGMILLNFLCQKDPSLGHHCHTSASDALRHPDPIHVIEKNNIPDEYLSRLPMHRTLQTLYEEDTTKESYRFLHTKKLEDSSIYRAYLGQKILSLGKIKQIVPIQHLPLTDNELNQLFQPNTLPKTEIKKLATICSRPILSQSFDKYNLQISQEINKKKQRLIKTLTESYHTISAIKAYLQFIQKYIPNHPTLQSKNNPKRTPG